MTRTLEGYWIEEADEIPESAPSYAPLGRLRVNLETGVVLGADNEPVRREARLTYPHTAGLAHGDVWHFVTFSPQREVYLVEDISVAAEDLVIVGVYDRAKRTRVPARLIASGVACSYLGQRGVLRRSGGKVYFDPGDTLPQLCPEIPTNASVFIDREIAQ